MIESRRIAVAAPSMGIVFVYFGIFYSAGIAQWMVWKRMTREVNRNPPRQRTIFHFVVGISEVSSRAG